MTGKAFDRIVQIWLENTDYQAAISTPAMQALLPQGCSLTTTTQSLTFGAQLYRFRCR